MRRRQEVACGGCGAVWRTAGARFCGFCGAVLHPIVATGRRRRAVAPRVVAVVGLAALLVAAGGLSVVALRAELGEAASPATDVELPDAEAVAPGRGLQGQARTEALAPFVTPRVTCEPEGCLRWQHRLDGGGDHWRRVTAVGDRIAVLEDDRFLLLDAVTGEEVRSERVTGTLSPHGARDPEVWDPAPHTLAFVDVVLHEPPGGRAAAGAPEGVLVTDDAHTVQFRDDEGQVRWTTRVPLRNPWWSIPLEDRIVVVGEPIDAPGATGLAAFARADGRLLWRQERQGFLQQAVPRALTIASYDLKSTVDEQTGEVVESAVEMDLEVLDPVTGATRFVLTVPTDTWLSFFGPWFVVRRDLYGIELDRRPPSDGIDALVDPTDGSVVADAPGLLDHAHVEVDGLVIGLLGEQRDRRGGHLLVTEVVAFDDRARVVWRQPLDEATGVCCATIDLVRSDRVAVQPGPNRAPVVLDVATGEPRTDVDPSRLRDPDDPSVSYWGDLRVRYESDAEVWVDEEGRRARVRGGGWPILVEPLVLLTDRQVVGIDLLPP